MASQQHDAVFDQSLDEDDEESSQSQDEDDLELNDDVLLPNDDALMEDEEDEELEEEEDLNSPSTSSPIIVTPSVTVALPAATPSATAVTVASIPNGNNSESTPDLKRPRIETTLIVHEERKPAPAPFDESRRLFQRLWTDEDEIELLQGFLDYTATRGGTSGTHHHHHHNDTALFYDQIKSKLQLDFNKNQLVEKLRRLKKKFRNVLNRIGSGKEFAFKSAHDQATFEISRKIWGNSGGRGSVDDTVLDDEEVNVSVNPNFSNFEVKSEYFATDKKLTPTPATSRSRKRSRPSKSGVKTEDNVANNAGNNESIGVGGNVIEETVRSCLSPIFKELLSGVMMGGGGGGGVCGGGRGIGGLAMNAMPLSFGMPAVMMGCFTGSGGDAVDERWRKQQILELEVYSKRLELVQDQIKAALEELRSLGG